MTGKKLAVEEIIKIYKDDKDKDYLTKDVLIALGNVGDIDAINNILKIFESDEDKDYLTKDVLAALGQAGKNSIN